MDFLTVFLQNNKMTQPLIDCKIKVFAQNPYCITVDVSTLVFIKISYMYHVFTIIKALSCDDDVKKFKN